MEYDFIDPDEGREVDWDSHLNIPEPFFAEALPCECCGTAVDERRPALWNEGLYVGECCYNRPSVPDEPACVELLKIIALCSLTADVGAAMDAHRTYCSRCQQIARIQPRSEVREMRQERAA